MPAVQKLRTVKVLIYVTEKLKPGVITKQGLVSDPAIRSYIGQKCYCIIHIDEMRLLRVIIT